MFLLLDNAKPFLFPQVYQRVADIPPERRSFIESAAAEGRLDDVLSTDPTCEGKVIPPPSILLRDDKLSE